MVQSPVLRGVLGFTAAAFAVLLLQQGMSELLQKLDIPELRSFQMPYDTTPQPPYGLPALAQLCLWGGAWGALFGVFAPVLWRPLWFPGLMLSVLVAIATSCVSAMLRGVPASPDWLPSNWALSLLEWGFWGLGLGLFYAALAQDST